MLEDRSRSTVASCRVLILVKVASCLPRVLYTTAKSESSRNGWDMRTLDFIHGMLATLASPRTRQRSTDFSCANCESVNRCALLPSNKCIRRLTQIEHSWKKPIKKAIWPYPPLADFRGENVLYE